MIKKRDRWRQPFDLFTSVNLTFSKIFYYINIDFDESSKDKNSREAIQ
jgi:hypothetical protein